uniref:Uncharacterized protein n=1 Tax=Micrurus lemniscatus lemniscatus TaxID=129467 RepID=A0A2D4J8L8_MICLE
MGALWLLVPDSCCGSLVAGLAELAAKSDSSEEVGEEPGPGLEAEEGWEEGSASEAGMGPGQAVSHQLPSGSDSSEAGSSWNRFPGCARAELLNKGSNKYCKIWDLFYQWLDRKTEK